MMSRTKIERKAEVYNSILDAGIILALGVILFLGFSHASATALQRLCEHSDYSVAKISPCTGAPGTVINVTLRRKLVSPPSTLLFKRILTNGVPAQVRTSISGGSRPTATTPPQLCTTGGRRWEVWLLDATGQSQGVIGAFWPDCRGNSNANSSGRRGRGGNTSNSNVNSNGENPSPTPSPAPKGGDRLVPDSGSGPIDTCLVAAWEAVSVTDLGGRTTGGTGFQVTFKSDGTQSVNYSAMRPFTFRGASDTITYTGTAMGHISTKNKVARIKSVERAGVTVKTVTPSGSFNLRLPGLGPGGLGSIKDSNSYTCTENSLEYKTSVARDGHANYSVKLTRRRQ